MGSIGITGCFLTLAASGLALIVVPPEGWFHQHFNSGAEPARYLLKVLSRKFKLQPSKIQSAVPLAYGGWQIEYEDEDPEISPYL